MVRFSIIVILLFFVSCLNAQEWLKNLPAKRADELTFYDYRDAFYSYWAPFNVENGYYMHNGVKTKACGWKQFKRWEYTMESEIDPSSGKFPKVPAQVIYQEYMGENYGLKSASSYYWTSLGTNSSHGGYAGIGRLNCVAFHPSDTSIWWVGAASGGVWYTANNGNSWTCLTDNNGVLAISDIAIPPDYSVSNTIYIATGDKDGWDNNSIGVLKSTNGGANWFSTALSYNQASYGMVRKLLMDPNNSQVILAATSNGVVKTTNGGTSWNLHLSSISFSDLKSMPGNFSVLYGATSSGEIYVTTDGGGTWNQTFSDTSATRIELGVSPAWPSLVYALASGKDNGFYAFFKSIDTASTFTKVFDSTSMNLLGWSPSGNDKGGQGWYDLTVAVSRVNPSIILTGGVCTYKSTDGGLSWNLSNHWYGGGGAQSVHADKHCLKYRDNGDLFECNDGGVYFSSNDGGHWTDKTNGMITSQMYKLSVSATDSSQVIAGLQDNGTKLIDGGIWKDVMGGDGMECIIDYTDANIQYAEFPGGDLRLTTNHWSSTINIHGNIPGSPGGAWVTPFVLDPVDNQTIYAGYSDIWRSTDQGTNWLKISSVNSQDKFRCIAIAPSNTNVIYACDPDTMYKSTDHGNTWFVCTGSLPVAAGELTSIAVKKTDENCAWVTFGGFNSTRVYKTTNGGASWMNYSTGLPQIPVHSIVQNSQFQGSDQLYVGTENGVFVRNGTSPWAPYNSGLPNVRIGELDIFYSANPANSRLRAATYGRGLWETQLYSSTPSGIENTISDRFSVYPNPSDNNISIECPGNREHIRFSLLNPIGQPVYSGSVLEKTVISTNGLVPGIYFLRFENGKSFEFKKIIKN